LIGAVTIDGWVVIGLLGVMLILSIWVMYTKTMMLSRYEKANAAFLGWFFLRAFCIRFISFCSFFFCHYLYQENPELWSEHIKKHRR
jgi:sterol desaturase/sphingolipid hydroxylase (fatty acid hydroxylase superfamily)